MCATLGLLAPASAQAAFPGGNGKIAFHSRGHGTYDIYVIDPSGTGIARALDRPPEDSEQFPAWSADGGRIAFVAHEFFEIGPSDGFFGAGIYFASADGTDLRRPIADYGGGNVGAPAWSPDGTRLAASLEECFAEGGCSADIWTFGTGGDGFVRLTCCPHGPGRDPPPDDEQPAWSPDGTKIAFRSLRQPVGIYVMDADGSDQTFLGSGSWPDWSPDGSKIAFESIRDGNLEIYVMDADGSNPARLTHDPATDGSPAWSPDGTKIAFHSSRDENSEIYVMNADGSDETRLTNRPEFDASPDWQPLANGPPDCSGVSVTSGTLWPPNNKLRPLEVGGATDPDGDAVAITIGGVTQDESVGGAPDARLTGRPGEVELRAERDAHGDGRVYRIVFTGSDGRGGECTGTVKVSVPHHPGRPAVDSAPPSHDSFGP